MYDRQFNHFSYEVIFLINQESIFVIYIIFPGCLGLLSAVCFQLAQLSCLQHVYQLVCSKKVLIYRLQHALCQSVSPVFPLFIATRRQRLAYGELETDWRQVRLNHYIHDGDERDELTICPGDSRCSKAARPQNPRPGLQLNNLQRKKPCSRPVF